jgi:hypothetical protein
VLNSERISYNFAARENRTLKLTHECPQCVFEGFVLCCGVCFGFALVLRFPAFFGVSSPFLWLNRVHTCESSILWVIG